MKVISCHLENFASYESLDFQFDDKGLVLIQGPTGSGKSTLCDAIPWILFGRTAKNGSVDEILSWPGDKVTKGVAHLPKLTIVRTRGPKSKDNDLYYLQLGGYNFASNHVEHRGKDLNDTQRLINNLLGLNIDLYLSGAYFHEFSQTAQFFTTTAKNRRSICEQVVDLILAKSLQDKTTNELKQANNDLNQVTTKISQLTANIALLTKMQVNETNKFDIWNSNKIIRLAGIESKVLQFEDDRKLRIEYNKKKMLKINCSECGQVKPKSHRHTDLSAEILDEVNPYLSHLEQARTETNPHTGAVKDYSDEIGEVKDNLDDYNKDLMGINIATHDLELLGDVLADFRGALVQNTIKSLQDKTNDLLHNHFDAEIKVEFKIEDADKLEVSILKDSNICTYTQLSKGQRGMLKLCFGVSVMSTVQNHHGIKLNQVFFDESLDGLDDNNKLKAGKMLETLALEYDSIYLVEHSETVKAMIDQQYVVTLNNGNSTIAKV